MNPVKTSITPVLMGATCVRILPQKALQYANTIDTSNLRHWLSKAPYDIATLSPKDRLHFIAVLNAISFSYWGEPKWSVEYNGQHYDGAFGLVAAMGRALDRGVPLLDVRFLAQLSSTDLESILAGTCEIPLLDARSKILNEMGEAIVKKYDKDFSNIILAENHAVAIVDRIIADFPSFADSTMYNGHRVFFNKRAQLLAADMYYHLQDTPNNRLRGVEELTACADYKLPQLLRKEGILNYVHELANRIDAEIPITHGSREEVEIRAFTIFAVELITEALRNRAPGLLEIDVNNYLWLSSQQKFADEKPYHRTRTTAY